MRIKPFSTQKEESWACSFLASSNMCDIQGPPLHTSKQPRSSPDGTTKPQATGTISAHRSVHQISCVNVILDIVVLVM
jgi:hypothetical protein